MSGTLPLGTSNYRYSGLCIQCGKTLKEQPSVIITKYFPSPIHGLTFANMCLKCVVSKAQEEDATTEE